MTIRIKLKNDDHTRTVLVVGTHNGQDQDQRHLKPGEEAEFWVHSTRDLRVQEGEPQAIVPPAPVAPA